MEVGASKIKKFKRALRRDPNSTDANFGLALVYFKRGEFLEALPYAQKVSQIDPASADAKALLGSIYMALDRDAKAEQCLAEAIKLNAGNCDSYSRLAEVRYRRNDLAGAIRILQDATELFPRNSQTFNDLGVMYYLRGDMTEARERFNKARKVNPKDRDALFNLSVICLDEGKADKAVEALEQLIEVEPDRAAHYASLGRANQAAGKHDAAGRNFEEAVALNPDDAEAHCGLGVNLLQLGQLDVSLESLERCLELEPEHSGATFAMIGCLGKNGQTQEIVKLWERSVALTGRAEEKRLAIQPKLSTGRDVAPLEVMEKIERKVDELADEKVELSVIVPALDEAESLRPFQDKLTSALESIGKRYEIIYVDDGSQDDTLRVLRNINQGDDRVRVVSLVRPCGQATSLSVGFNHARGDIIVTADAGLQNDPEDIRTLLDKMAEGYDVVAGLPEGGTREPLGRKVRSFIANQVTSAVAGIKLRDSGSVFAAYDRAVLDNMSLGGEIYRFVPALASGLGFSTAKVPVKGDLSEGTKSGTTVLPVPVLDAITARFLSDTKTGPMRYFGKLGLCSTITGVIIAILVAVWAVLTGGSLAWIAFPIALFALFGALMVATGFIVEIVVRTYRHAQDRPTYLVKEVIE